MPRRSPARSAQPKPEAASVSAPPAGSPTRLVTSAQMRELDRRTIELGTPGSVLMERAGRGIAERVRREFGAACRRGVLVVAGRGNNGGDGFVVARLLKARGVRVTVVLLAERERVVGDARLNLDRWRRAGGRTIEVEGGDPRPVLERELARAGVVVDAILGTGLSSDVTGPIATAIEAMNDASTAAGERGPPVVVAVDVPSGLDADRGEPRGIAVRATATVTLGAIKVGLVLPVARPRVGALSLVDIGLAAEAWAALDSTIEIGSRETLAGLLSPRPATAHKGTHGHLVLVAGSRGKSGAAILAARGALRGGAGLVTVACPPDTQAAIAAGAPEIMTDPIRGLSAKEWRERLVGKSAFVIGPGLGTSPQASRLVRWLVTRAPAPVVLDADGLNAVATVPDLLSGTARGLVLTPHPGEMSRLVRRPVPEVQAARVDVALAFARRVNGVVVLKGSGTVVAAPDGRVSVNASGGPLLASGGTGDVLAGVIGSLLGQGLAPYDAARVGVYLHGRAADLLEPDLGDAGALASEIADRVPRARRELVSR
jgi:NAD(P)H-hydrate epimerase